jgi:hypothetical protein
MFWGEGEGGERWGEGGEVAQTMYTHMNKCFTLKKENKNVSLFMLVRRILSPNNKSVIL